MVNNLNRLAMHNNKTIITLSMNQLRIMLIKQLENILFKAREKLKVLASWPKRDLHL